MSLKRSYSKRREGASAVEFALVAPIFFGMMFAVMELGIVFTVDSVLQNAMMESGRLVRTGRADNEGIDETEFKQELCSRMSIFENECTERAHIDIRTIAQFIGPTLPDPLENGKSFDEDQIGYDIGGPGSLMLVRVWYEKPLITPFLTQALSKLGDGTMLMTATTTFRNEPYQPAPAASPAS